MSVVAAADNMVVIVMNINFITVSGGNYRSIPITLSSLLETRISQNAAISESSYLELFLSGCVITN